MIKSIFAVYDRKTRSVELIQQAENVDVFERWFANVFLMCETVFSRFPDDFDVYVLCTYDTESLEGDKSWSPAVITSVSAILDHFHLARSETGHSDE